MGGIVFFVPREQMTLHWLVLLALFSSVIPLAQYFFGVVYFAGSACLGCLFLLGLALAILVGERWESVQKEQAIDGLFLAIGVGAVTSVGMQLCQWLGLEILGVWLVPSDASRPFANLAQPNNLGTFLLWGGLACAWGYSRKFLSANLALLLAMFFVFGIGLTQSRTAFVGLLLVVALSFFWRRHQGVRQLFHAALMLFVFLVLCLIAIPQISDALHISVVSRISDADMVVRDTARSVVYRLFFEASLSKALVGYGWANTGDAFFSAIGPYPELGVVFYHAHNLFLDLLLWFGWPIGLLLIGAVLCWGWGAFRRVDNIDSVVLFLFVLLVGWHSMVEFPLHYASFLLPCGLVIGVINARSPSATRFQFSKWPVVALLLFVLIGLGVLARDYALVEDDAQALRYERLNIQVTRPHVGAEILLLTQLKSFLAFSFFEPKKGLTQEELTWVENSAFTIFNPLNTFNFIQILALNGRVEEAQMWIRRVKHVVPESTYADMSRQWTLATEGKPELAKVIW